MVRGCARQFFLKAARFVVRGAIIPRHGVTTIVSAGKRKNVLAVDAA
jgi:hypothetical protein